MVRKKLAFLILAAFAVLPAAREARAATVDRDPVPATLERRFGVPVIGGLAGGPDGRLYARAYDRLPGGFRLPRGFWWTWAPGERRWTLLPGQESGYDTWLLAPDPLHAGVVYAATPKGLVLRSEDGGSTWEERGSVPGPTYQLLVTAADLLIVGDPGKCAPCRSGDGGRTWERRSAFGTGTLVPAPGDPRVFYWFWTEGILRSTDGARSFQDVSPAAPEGAIALAVAPSGADIVYALSSVLNGFLSRTLDGGASWTRLVPPSPGLTWSGPAVDPASASHLFILGGPADLSIPRRLFESFDAGRSWTRHAGAVNATELRLPGAGEGLEIEAFGRRGIFTSGDRGEHWVQSDAGVTADAELLLTGAGNGDLYVTVQDGGATWRSRDGGLTWERRGTVPGFQPFGYASLGADPLDPEKLLAFGGDGYGLWWSDDGGRTWSFRRGPRFRGELAFINAVFLDPHRKDTVYAATTEDAWRSVDRGLTWTRFTASLPSGTDCNHSGCFEIRDVEAIVPDPFDPQRFYAAAHTYGFFRTRDGGVTWKALQSPALAASEGPTLRPDPSVRGRLYWGMEIETQVYQSDRAGLPPWKAVLKTGALGPVGSESWLTFDPRGRLVVQPEIHTARILRRLGEDTWERIPILLPRQEDVRVLDPLVAVAGGEARIFLLVPGLGLFRADLPEPP
jgi:photosystem II stability/assembly factor-like uncharacterized protein